MSLNPAQVAQAQAFLSLFRGDSTEQYTVMYEDATGVLRGLFVSTSRICLANSNYETYRAVAPPYPVRNHLVMVVRDAIDLKVPVVTLYDYVHPSDIGLTAPDTFEPGPGVEALLPRSDTKWKVTYLGVDYSGATIWNEFGGLSSDSANFTAGKSAPWVRVRSIDFTPFANTSAACTAPMDTLLGNGLCRRSFVGNYYPWYLTASYGIVPGTNVYAGYYGYGSGLETVDNIVIEQVWDNMTVDFAPATPDNPIRPKSPGWSIYIAIKATSVAAGDDYDFNPVNVDPASLKLGTKLAPVLNYQPSDVDGDGDTDYTYQFNTGATGITCLDTRITLTGKTYSGAPVAGYDSVAPVGCTETILMDVDPFNATNTVRPNDNYNVTVAVLGMRTASGDAINLYPESTAYSDGLNRTLLKFGPAETPLVGTPIVTDIDGDGNSDLLANFNVFNAGIACGDTQVQLKGSKISGIPIMAVDNIVTEDCETSSCHP